MEAEKKRADAECEQSTECDESDKMEEEEDIVVSATEIIPDRLYFATVRQGFSPRPTRNSRYLEVSDWLVYENFYLDFGPYHLCHLYQFCQRLRSELAAPTTRKLVFHTSDEPTHRLNAACLIGCYQIIYQSRSPEEVYAGLVGSGEREGEGWALLRFRDASAGFPVTLGLLDVFRGLHKALHHNFFDFDDFDEEQYLFYETVENGDLNWIVPDKMLAFSGPHARSMLQRGYPLHSPEHYHQYFRTHNVTCIVRLNKKSYDAKQFTAAGFEHKDLFFVDGSVPSSAIVQRFLRIAEAAPGALAVHCKAGLGRTGTLVACYVMKHYGFTAMEAIAWLRLCRPGSVISHQQTFLLMNESRMHAEGVAYRRRHGLSGPPTHTHGVYSKRAHARTHAPVSLHTILDNASISSNKVEEEGLLNGNKTGPGARLRHYMLPTSSATGRNNTLSKPVESLSRRSAAGAASCPARRRRRRNNHDADADDNLAETNNSQGNRLYKIKALRSGVRVAPAPPAPAAPPPARVSARTKSPPRL